MSKQVGRYVDAAQSGVGSDRPAHSRMLSAAYSCTPGFDVLLVDDASRLSRSLPEIVQVQQKLNFAGIRVVVVSQGIDSSREQAELLFAIHGIVDSLCVRELAKKTHRGVR